MRLVSQFACDVCSQPIGIQDGMVIWDDRDYPISLFVVHNWPGCRTENTLETCPLSCTLTGFIASNGLREYFSLLVASQDFSPTMKRFMEKGLISPNVPGFSSEDLLQRTVVHTEADFAIRRVYLKRSIVESVGRFFEDFNDDTYFLTGKELEESIRQDLAGEGPAYA